MALSVLLGPPVGKALRALRERQERRAFQARSAQLARQAWLDHEAHQAPRVIPDRSVPWGRKDHPVYQDRPASPARKDQPAHPDQLALWDTTSKPSACTNGNP